MHFWSSNGLVTALYNIQVEKFTFHIVDATNITFLAKWLNSILILFYKCNSIIYVTAQALCVKRFLLVYICLSFDS